eukprot:TRINITY_DN11537_c1_g1_i1.p1 TRINITY_DN11537_c1_g1~~TRINITY_DN11537_c1_g1_i1.p1  ORF type:complete len:383 (+),score=59.72 TRINITY_DN11537_c1_g1_i1:40-1188(+)
MSQVKESAAQGGTMQSYFYTDLDDGQVSAAIRSQVGNPNALADTGPKMCAYVSPKPTDSELRFVKQMGVTHVFTWFEKWQDVSLKELHRFVNQLERSGLRVYNIGCLEIAKSTEIILNTALALTHISCFKEFIGWLAAVGVATTTFTWEATGKVYSCGKSLVRGHGTGRKVDADRLAALPTRDDAPTEEQLWDNMRIFLSAMLPELERHEVRLALHPNDPPLPSVEGIPCLMRSRQAFEKVFSLAAESPWIKMEFCCGTWMEGLHLPDTNSDANPLTLGSFGDGPNALLEALTNYVAQDKVAIVHLRNCTASLPRFAETYIDDGFMSIGEIVEVLVGQNYQGTIILDHTPAFEGEAGEAAATAFSIGYIKACVKTTQRLLVK